MHSYVTGVRLRDYRMGSIHLSYFEAPPLFGLFLPWAVYWRNLQRPALMVRFVAMNENAYL